MTAAEVVEDVEMKEEKVRTNAKLPGFLSVVSQFFRGVYSAQDFFFFPCYKGGGRK